MVWANPKVTYLLIAKVEFDRFFCDFCKNPVHGVVIQIMLIPPSCSCSCSVCIYPMGCCNKAGQL